MPTPPRKGRGKRMLTGGGGSKKKEQTGEEIRGRGRDRILEEGQGAGKG